MAGHSLSRLAENISHGARPMSSVEHVIFGRPAGVVEDERCIAVAPVRYASAPGVATIRPSENLVCRALMHPP